MIKTCIQCGKDFETRFQSQKFCSVDCVNKYNTGRPNPKNAKRKIKLICEHCRKEFYVLPSRKVKQGKKRQFCSVACRALSNIGAKAPRWGGGPVTKICAHCGKTFQRRKAEAESRYCSKKCFDEARQKRVSMICETCGKEFFVRIPVAKRGRRFCSNKCVRKPTNIEIIIRSRLDEIGIDFIPEYRIGRYSIDVFVPSVNLAVECDGGYWHSFAIGRDARKDKALKQMGIDVLRLREKDILERPDWCIQLITSRM